MRPTLESLMNRDDLKEYIVSYVNSANKELSDALRTFQYLVKIVNDPSFSAPRNRISAEMAMFAWAIEHDVDNLFGDSLEFLEKEGELATLSAEQQAEPTKAPIRPRPVTASKDATGAADREENVVTSPEQPSDN